MPAPKQLIAHAAEELRNAIERGAPEHEIGQAAQGLVNMLGGTARITDMSPGAAALYLQALTLSQPGW